MLILVVDDELVARSKMASVLSDYGTVQTADCGRQAIERLEVMYQQGSQPDLVTIDIEMPDTDGLELLQWICAMETMKKIKPAVKLMISAHSSYENVKMSAQNRCQGFLVKPVSARTLREKLKDLNLIDHV